MKQRFMKMPVLVTVPYVQLTRDEEIARLFACLFAMNVTNRVCPSNGNVVTMPKR